MVKLTEIVALKADITYINTVEGSVDSKIKVINDRIYILFRNFVLIDDNYKGQYMEYITAKELK